MRLHPVDFVFFGVLYWDVVMVIIVFIAVDAYPS